MMSPKIPSPKDFFGYQMGEDRKLARWDKLVEYYQTLSKRSDKVKLVELGKTTEGNSFIMVVVSSPENISRIDEIKRIGPTLAHETLTELQLDRIVKEGKAVIAMAMSIHASEVGGAQMAPELVHDLITLQNPEVEKILEETVLVLIPSANPDGNVMVVDYYNKQLGTEYEGGSLPWLYHKYVGHDNNRDLPLQNMGETKLMAKLLFNDWYPLAYLDYHHYGSFGGRYYIPPFVNPTDPNVDPYIWTEQQLYGAAMIMKLEEEDCEGIENYAGFTAEFNAAYTRVCSWLGICGMLTESASAKLATPKYVHNHQLSGTSRGRPEYRAHVNFPHPWEGGWWTLKDIVKQQKVSALAALEVAAKYRETFLRNLYKKAQRCRVKGETEPPYACIIPPMQNDPSSTRRLLEALRGLGVSIQTATSDFKVGDITYPSGSYIIYYSQVSRPYLMSTLMEHRYHDGPWSRNNEGAPMGLQDIAGYTLPLMMGVKAYTIEKPFSAETRKLKKLPAEGSSVTANAAAYLLNAGDSNSYKAVNILLGEGFKVYRVNNKNSYYIPNQEGVIDHVNSLSDIISFKASDELATDNLQSISPSSIGLYQRYFGGNMDEGWTRWLLEQYGFNYSTVIGEQAVESLKDLDVLIMPSDAPAMITGEKLEEYYEKKYNGRMVLPKYPPEYMGGVNEEGVKKIREWVEAGGNLVLMNESCEFALESLNLPLMNVLKDLKPKDFFCPGSMLTTKLNKETPLTYGLAEDTPILYQGVQAYAVKPGNDSDDFTIAVSLPEEDMLRSGWLIGENKIGRKAIVLEAKLGKGRVVMIGFRCQFRAQTNATFKLLFNALYN